MAAEQQNADSRNRLRADIDALIAEGGAQKANTLLGELWRSETGPATAAFLCSRYEKLRGALPMVRHRTAILRSFTVEPVVPLLRASAFAAGIDLDVHLGDFNVYAQEILDGGSSLYRYQPDSVLLALRTPDLAPELWQEYTALTADAVTAACERVTQSFDQWLRAFRERSSAALIMHNLEQPIRPMPGILDAQSRTSQEEGIRQINSQLHKIVRQYTGVYLLDYDGLVARHGRLHWQDDRKYLMARLPISAENLIHLAGEWLRFLAPICGRTAKVLVTDLDNTLWGGVIGEDGMPGIRLGPEYPGAAYQALQRALLDLTHRGILLAICSKNNPDEALEAIERHPGMILRSQHFAAMRISWNDKVRGLREIAAELNLGLDSLAFLDDNPFEREQVRAALPEVMIVDLPDNPLDYAAVVRDCPAFERLTLSGEDRQRTEMYAEQRQRSQAEQSFQSKEDFYHFLQQEAEIWPLSPETRARVAQLTQKTNQFNLTTRRYTEQDLTRLAENGCEVLSIRVRDRFGDHGIVGVAITRYQDRECEIDTFLLSCRVIGRTVETALLFQICQNALARGCQRLVGWFLPTKKNAPAMEFYGQHGFELVSKDGRGSLWAFNLQAGSVSCPEWIKLTFKTENTIAAKHS